MKLSRPMAGLSQVTRGLGTLDREVFEAVAESPTALLDTAMPVLTRAADHSKLWMAIAALLMKGPRSNRRGAVRGLATLAVTSLFTNQVAKRVWSRSRPCITPAMCSSVSGSALGSPSSADG